MPPVYNPARVRELPIPLLAPNLHENTDETEYYLEEQEEEEDDDEENFYESAMSDIEEENENENGQFEEEDEIEAPEADDVKDALAVVVMDEADEQAIDFCFADADTNGDAHDDVIENASNPFGSLESSLDENDSIHSDNQTGEVDKDASNNSLDHNTPATVSNGIVISPIVENDRGM